jgi:NADH dehydrogenase
MSDSTVRHRIVILGGGFGGVYTAMHLGRIWRKSRDADIVLVSRENYFLMTPFLFEAGSGVLDPRHAVAPIRRLLEGTPARFVEADVEAVDFNRRVVHARHAPGDPDAYEIPYDHLVIALGGVTNLEIIPGSEHAMTFKTLADAIFLRNHVIDAFEHADATPDDAERRRLLSFVVIGAGLVGVELMGELTAFVRAISPSYPLTRDTPRTFHLIEAGPHIMPEMERDLADYAGRALESRGVRVRASSPARRIDPGQVHLPDGSTIEAHTIVLAAGVAPNPLLATFPIEKNPKNRVAVDGTMRSKSDPNVWAIGDCALIPDPTGKPYPQLAQHALREARVLARNITCTIRGGAPEPFIYHTLGILASLGDFQGVGRVKKMKIRGFVAWWVWRSYYLMQMPRFERKLRIVLDWTVALFFRHDIVKLDLFGEQHPLRQRGASGAPRPDGPVSSEPPPSVPPPSEPLAASRFQMFGPPSASPPSR